MDKHEWIRFQGVTALLCERYTNALNPIRRHSREHRLSSETQVIHGQQALDDSTVSIGESRYAHQAAREIFVRWFRTARSRSLILFTGVSSAKVNHGISIL